MPSADLPSLINEADLYFGPARPKACVISMGTGMQPKVSFKDGEMLSLKDSERFVDIVTGAESAHLLIKDDSRVRGCYHRFNPGKRNTKGDDWLKPIELYEWNKMSTWLVGLRTTSRRHPPRRT